MKNLAKILKDCPKGTKLYSPLFGEVEFYSVENNDETNICYVVVLDPQDPFYSKEEYRDLSRVSFSSDGRWIDGRGECMLFPTKAKDIRDWNTFAEKLTEFKNGDFVVSKNGIVGIYRERLDAGRPSSDAITHCHYSHDTLWIDDLLGNITRRATDEEKQKLLDKIDENGYEWDSEKLELRKKECPNFKKGDFVARVYDSCEPYILLMGDTDWSSQNNHVRCICYVDLSDDEFYAPKSTNCWCSVEDFYEQGSYRLATDDEKAKLLDAIDKHGYVWDSVKLELRKKDEKPNFKKGDFVVDYVSVYKYVLIVGDGNDWTDSDCKVSCICYMRDEDKMLTIMNKNEHWGTVGQCARARYATEEERQQLLGCIVDNGYVWDSEKLELCKIEEKPKFKKGDFVVDKGIGKEPYIIILKDDVDFNKSDETKHYVRYACYMCLEGDGMLKIAKKPTSPSWETPYWCGIDEFIDARPATEEEKQKLLNSLEENGYVWDEEKLELRKKECPNFKRGEFVAHIHDYDGKSTILLMGDTDWSSPNNDGKYICYVDLSDDEFYVSESTDYWGTVKTFYDDDRYRLATDDEKKKLLDAIDKHGYVWDDENIELRKKEHEFEPYEKVLIRDSEVAVWCAATFSHINEHSDFKYNCGGTNWKYCIPYKGNESLRGTANAAKQ